MTLSEVKKVSIRKRLNAFLGVALLAAAVCSSAASLGAEEPRAESVFSKDNLVAWCIVPFDAAGRSPDQRAVHDPGLGIKKVAYDWREQHVESFEDEILAYRESWD